MVVVAAVYLAVVLGLGRSPTDDERALLVLSMIAAAVAALVYPPTQARLARLANQITYGEQHAPDEILRTFSSRLTRAIPLEEMLLQAAESLRKTLHLDVVEVWTGSGGLLERTVSTPEQPDAGLTLSPQEQAVVAQAGVCGPAWITIWTPSLLEGRDGLTLRLAPIANGGQLLGLIVTGTRESEQWDVDDEQVLTELARQIGVALHNVQLDSALQASLEEVRRQADELQESRARIVAAADASRREIERNLHDGAQQHLVAMAVKLRLVRQQLDRNPEMATEMLKQLGGDLQDAVQELRDLAHGIYPPLLADRGLAEALRAAGNRAALPTSVDADGVERYPPPVEAAVYFCCLEALQNAGKHAGDDASIGVRVWEEAGALLFEVRDDGAGFDAAGQRPRRRVRQHERPSGRGGRPAHGGVDARDGHGRVRTDPAPRNLSARPRHRAGRPAPALPCARTRRRRRCGRRPEGPLRCRSTSARRRPRARPPSTGGCLRYRRRPAC